MIEFELYRFFQGPNEDDLIQEQATWRSHYTLDAEDNPVPNDGRARALGPLVPPGAESEPDIYLMLAVGPDFRHIGPDYTSLFANDQQLIIPDNDPFWSWYGLPIAEGWTQITYEAWYNARLLYADSFYDLTDAHNAQVLEQLQNEWDAQLTRFTTIGWTEQMVIDQFGPRPETIRNLIRHFDPLGPKLLPNGAHPLEP